MRWLYRRIKLRVFLGKKFRHHEDLRLLLSPLDVLTRLSSASSLGWSAGMLALFFDAYDQPTSA